MQFTIAAVLAVATTAFALPSSDGGSGTCAKGSDISCCVTDSSGSGTAGNVLGGSCLLSQVSLLSLLDNVCPAGNTFCCPTNQDGTLNVNAACIPVNV
ncbi:hypothetical protein M409DRAFT_20711 [Zasmidium cellare ATCC 36951]|uniref:Hydrophobin n=1 Tax=Zasmidium cellare ATCC 36951 TaxID=1080233 RepID=A0A6A6CQD0_ZASCE|nr:uncharacterized protein M409DRAFT_20711 [Zasmidium cellare ATCC 36951]KAF2169497.1 hypothetical protein M409DRAFT_20711 [Zasmidium cellare ATCC 36951]